MLMRLTGCFFAFVFSFITISSMVGTTQNM
jgi:hypothetical protein